jgi:hypothetical protein
MFARKSDLREVDEIARRLGIDRDLASKRLHMLKRKAGLRGKSVEIGEDGTLTDPVSGEEIGNICDE